MTNPRSPQRIAQLRELSKSTNGQLARSAANELRQLEKTAMTPAEVATYRNLARSANAELAGSARNKLSAAGYPVMPPTRATSRRAARLSSKAAAPDTTKALKLAIQRMRSAGLSPQQAAALIVKAVAGYDMPAQVSKVIR